MSMPFLVIRCDFAVLYPSQFVEHVATVVALILDNDIYINIYIKHFKCVQDAYRSGLYIVENDIIQ